MTRKVLHGLAHNMCQIFLGLQVWEDLSRLEELGAPGGVAFSVCANDRRL